MKAAERIIQWKRLPNDPNTHDQWNAENREMVIRKVNDFEYALYVKGVHKTTVSSLSAAKNKAEYFDY